MDQRSSRNIPRPLGASGSVLGSDGRVLVWQEREEILLSTRGILPDDGDVTAALTDLIAETGGDAIIVFDRPGTYEASTATTVGSLKFVVPVAVDNITLRGVPGAVLETEEDAYLIAAMGNFKPGGTAAWAANEFVDAAVYPIAAAAKDALSVTTVTAADAGNLAAGDWVILRTGQTLGSGTAQPDGEVNVVESAVAGTGVVTLRYPLAKAYAQEYFISGTSGYTSTSVTANPAVLGIAKVTDRVLHGFRVYDLTLRAPNATSALLNTSQCIGQEVAGCVLETKENLNGSGGSRFARFVRNDIVLTGSGSGWAFAADKFCGDFEVAHNRAAARRVGYVHLHEGCYRINVHDNVFVSDLALGSSDMVSIRSRAYDLSITDNVFSGASFTAGIRIDALSNGGGVIRGNAILGAPVSGEVIVFSSDWVVEGNRPANHRVVWKTGVSSVGAMYPNVPTGGPPQRQEVSGAWLADDFQEKVVAVVPAFAVVDSVRIQVQQAFNSDGTDTIEVGTAADNDAYATATDVSATGIKTVTPGVSAGLYQSTAVTVSAYYANGGSEPTTGRALVEVFWHRVPQQVD